MSEPLRHDRLGALCAPTCPGCRAAAKEQRAAERRGTLKTATLGTLVQEIGDRFTALSTENANLRTQAQTVADKTESLRTLDAARVTQIRDLEKSRDTERTRVRNLRQGIGVLAGYASAGTAGPLDFQLVALVAKKLQDLRSQLNDLESTASEQDESLATTSETHRLIFDLVHQATGVRTEGLTVSEAVEKVVKALKDVQRMRDLALDRESLRESDLEQAREELEEARQNNAQMADAIEAMRKEVAVFRTAQAPRWYPVGTSLEVGVNETTRRANLEDYSIRVPEARSYVWLDRDRDPWAWSAELEGWKSYRRHDGTVRALTVVVPSQIHGPYECAGLIRPVTDSPETLNNLSTNDDQRWSRSYSWIDRDGDAWVWVPVVNQWMCVGRPWHGEELGSQDVSLRPSSEHGPYQRGERVSG